MTSVIPDQELLRRYAAGPAEQRDQSFRELVERHGRMVAGVCRRIAGADGDDAAQAVFLVLARRAEQLSEHPSVGGWLHRTAVQIATRQRDATTTRRRHERGIAMQSAIQELSETDTAHGDPVAMRRQLDACLDVLPDRYRLPLVLHYLEGRSQAEVAETLGMSVSTFTSTLSRARDRLREIMTRRGVLAPAALLVLVLGETAAQDAAGSSLVFTDGMTAGSAVSSSARELAEIHLRGSSVLGAGTIVGTCAAIVAGILAVCWMAWPEAEPAPPMAAVVLQPDPVLASQQVVEVRSSPARLDIDDAQRQVLMTFPDAARQALQAAAGERRWIACEIDQEDGITIYEAEIANADGSVTEYVVDADGRLVKQETEPAPAPAAPPAAPRNDGF